MVQVQYVLLIALLLTASWQEPQAPRETDTTAKVLNVQQAVLVQSAMGRSSWPLVYQFAAQKPLTHSEVISALQKLVGNPRKPESAPEEVYELLKKHQKRLETALHALSNETFLYADTVLPISVAKRNEDTVLLLGGIALPTVFNTLQSTERSRATQTLSAKLLPALKKIQPLLDHEFGSDFSHVGLTVIYASKNFVNRSEVLNLESEAITLIAPLAAYEKYVSGDLSDDDFLAASETFLVDRTDPGVKKVTTLRFQ